VSSVVVSLPRLELCAQPAPSDAGECAEVLQRWEDGEGRLVAVGGRTRDGWWIRWSRLATFTFSAAGPVYAYPLRPGLEGWVRDTFIRGVTPIILLARGLEGFHASAVLAPSGVIGFFGLSETGKSTLALALAAGGLPHVADDALIYRIVAGRATVVPIPFPVRVDSAASELFELRSLPTAKAPSGSDGVPISRIYLLRRDATLDPVKPVFEAIRPVNRFEVLLTHAHPFEMGTGGRRREFLENLLTMARTVDLWECRFAPDLGALRSLAGAVRAHATETLNAER
jgi:hypothetical protein